MNQVVLNKLVKSLGFNSIQHFKEHMLSRAKLNDYGAICHTEKRQGFELNYSDNCKCKFGIGGNISGTFRDHRFN